MIITRETKKPTTFLEKVVYLNDEDDLAIFLNHSHEQYSNIIHVNSKLLSSKKLHYAYFIGNRIMTTVSNESDIAPLFLNPMVKYLKIDADINISNYSSNCLHQRHIQNIVCHIDLKNILENTSYSIGDILDLAWGYYMAYNIYNFPHNKDCISTYENLAHYLGVVRDAHPVNDKSTKFSNSRDIKYNPNIPHYFASNSRQPLHTDYAYYPENNCPDWLMLYCIKPSEFGGITSLLSTKTLHNILRTYNETLLEDILNTNVTYHYEGADGDTTHTKSLFDGKHINWNYYQIKDTLNDEAIMNTVKSFYTFLEDKIAAGQMFDFSKRWNSGDCIIFNDHLMLHGRSAFLGDRWLKDHAFYNKEKNNG
tara:strand:+ start:824 stop:1921 length:1098 start_codon:yes stop_codon:yes gene_type:complete